MIQRIQSVWLLLAAIFCAGLFYFDLYRVDLIEGVTVKSLRAAGDNYGLFLTAVIMVILPLVALFMFKARKKQRTLVLLAMVVNIGFIALTLMTVSNINNGTSAPVTGSYWIGSVLPVLSFICLILAFRGIRRDDKLVKSLDRLR